MKKNLLPLIIICLLASIAFADELPKPRGYVNDFAGIIDGGRAQQIESACASIERTTGVEISVVTIDSLRNYSIEEMGLRFLEEWGVGQKGKDNGVVILIAMTDREIRIENGYGIEEVLPDGKAGEIIRYEIGPRFKQGDYGGGLLAAVYKIGKIVGGEIVTYPSKKRRRKSLGSLIYLVFFLIMIISSIFGRGRRRGRGLGLLWFMTGFGMGRTGGFGGSSGSSGGFGSFGGFGGGMGGGGGASGGW
ncbi:MAG: TPM domain-containing protein [candidate division Zixibacteria bacterium]|nr:TPM domain-containing protein [candidate division Zixibacteria bacterium]